MNECFYAINVVSFIILRSNVLEFLQLINTMSRTTKCCIIVTSEVNILHPLCVARVCRQIQE